MSEEKLTFGMLIAWVRTQAQVSVQTIITWALEAHEFQISDESADKAFAALIEDGYIDAEGNVFAPDPEPIPEPETPASEPESVEPPALPTDDYEPESETDEEPETDDEEPAAPRKRSRKAPLVALGAILLLTAAAASFLFFPGLRFWESSEDYYSLVDEAPAEEEILNADMSSDMAATDSTVVEPADSLVVVTELEASASDSTIVANLQAQIDSLQAEIAVTKEKAPVTAAHTSEAAAKKDLLRQDLNTAAAQRDSALAHANASEIARLNRVVLSLEAQLAPSKGSVTLTLGSVSKATEPPVVIEADDSLLVAVEPDSLEAISENAHLERELDQGQKYEEPSSNFTPRTQTRRTHPARRQVASRSSQIDGVVEPLFIEAVNTSSETYIARLVVWGAKGSQYVDPSDETIVAPGYAVSYKVDRFAKYGVEVRYLDDSPKNHRGRGFFHADARVKTIPVSLTGNPQRIVDSPFRVR
ncbi:MAG: hypothetical protein WCV86_04805 [Patescibacteria group bacterium]|jgi:flagellar basal body-associated protein FliL